MQRNVQGHDAHNLSWYGPEALLRYRLYHQDEINCLMHGIFLPLACSGFFLILLGLLGLPKGHRAMTTIITFYSFYYFYVHIVGGLYVFVYYNAVIAPLSFIFAVQAGSRKNMIIRGIVLLLFCMYALEFVSHTKYENLQSNLGEFHVSLLNGHLFSVMSLFGIKIPNQ